MFTDPTTPFNLLRTALSQELQGKISRAAAVTAGHCALVAVNCDQEILADDLLTVLVPRSILANVSRASLNAKCGVSLTLYVKILIYGMCRMWSSLASSALLSAESATAPLAEGAASAALGASSGGGAPVAAAVPPICASRQMHSFKLIQDETDKQLKKARYELECSQNKFLKVQGHFCPSNRNILISFFFLAARRLRRCAAVRRIGYAMCA